MTQPFDPALYHVRRFAGELKEVEKGLLSGLAVPYDAPADVVDVDPNGNALFYREGFRPGVFGKQVASKEYGRITLRDEHEGVKLGIAVALEDQDEGLGVRFRVKPSLVNDVAMMLESGQSDLSVGFRQLRGGTVRDEEGTIWRTRAYLDHVALEAEGAYAGATVTSFRQADLEASAQAEEQGYKRQLAELDSFLAEAEAENARLRELLGR